MQILIELDYRGLLNNDVSYYFSFLFHLHQSLKLTHSMQLKIIHRLKIVYTLIYIYIPKNYIISSCHLVKISIIINL